MNTAPNAQNRMGEGSAGTPNPIGGCPSGGVHLAEILRGGAYAINLNLKRQPKGGFKGG